MPTHNTHQGGSYGKQDASADQLLFRGLQSRARETSYTLLPNSDRGLELQESVKQWEASRRALREIQNQLTQAYQELEPMQM